MATQAKRVAGFRKRLSRREATWAIDILATKRVNLELTEEQQEVLRRATRHVFPSLDLIFYSDEIAPSGHALACLKFRKSGSSRKGKARSKRARASARSSR
jgi:hypothetical protein